MSVHAISPVDRKSTRLNSSHTEIYTLSLHDALPILGKDSRLAGCFIGHGWFRTSDLSRVKRYVSPRDIACRSEEYTFELQSHRDLHSFPTRRSSDLRKR